MKRRFLIFLFATGTILGFGSAFAHYRHGGDCHRGWGWHHDGHAHDGSWHDGPPHDAPPRAGEELAPPGNQ